MSSGLVKLAQGEIAQGNKRKGALSSALASVLSPSALAKKQVTTQPIKKGGSYK